MDQNGQIHPGKNEVLLEMKINHNVGNLTEIENYIKENLEFRLLGNTWIANNGQHFMTIGFRTYILDHEYWKAGTLNWQDSNIKAVSISRLYR